MIDLSMLPQGAITAILQVIMIDLVLAGDNAVVIGLAAAGLPPVQRNRAILVGIIAATVLRLAFAAIAVELLAIVGLLLAGGILLLWVCWKMWRELRGPGAEDTEAALLKRDAHAQAVDAFTLCLDKGIAGNATDNSRAKSAPGDDRQ